MEKIAAAVTKFFKQFRTGPFVSMVLLAALAAAFLPIWPGGLDGTRSVAMTGYVVTWFGGVFQALTGALLGWYFLRFVMRLDLSSYEDKRDRAIAGAGACFLIGMLAIAVAVAA